MMENQYEFIIIGAGPAGLQMGYFLKQSQRSYVILERSESPGAFFKKYPRHRSLISINKIHTGYDDPEQQLRWDWNSLLSDDLDLRVRNYSKRYFPTADEYVHYLNDFATKTQLNIKTNANVTKIQKRDGEFIVELASGELLRARCLLMATGMPKEYAPDIPGIETVEQYGNAPVDPENYNDQRVLVIGKGNSGFEFADELLATTRLIHITSPNPIKFAWRSHFPGHVRALNMEFLDTYQLKSQNALINAEIKRIELKDKEYHVTFAYKLANDEEETLVYDRVVCCTGFKFDIDIFDADCRPELTMKNRLPAMSSWFESTNVSDLFFVGTLMQTRDYKKKQSTFIHGFRYNIQFLTQYLLNKYFDTPIPAAELSSDVDLLAREIIKNVNRSSSLWQQTGFLCDALIRDTNNETFCYYRTVPTDYLLESDFTSGRDFFTITLEFGQAFFDQSMNTFAVERIHKDDYERADQSPGLHPVIRHYRGNQLISVHHVIEDFANEWLEAVHVAPLKDYLAQSISQLQTADAAMVA